MNKELIRPFLMYLKIVLIAFVLVIIFTVDFHAHYDRNYFEVFLNGQKMHYILDETFQSTLVLYSHVSEDQVYDLDNIDATDSYVLNLKEYEVYIDSTRKQAYDFYIKDSNTLVKVKSNPYKLIIKNKDGIIYNGAYKEDISNYLNKKGRYYIHIYNNRKDNFYSSVKTHLSFSVNVGDSL